MRLTAIGRIASERASHQWDGWQSLESEIHILPDFTKALRGLEDYSHVIVVYAMDTGGTVNLEVTPQCKPTSPCVGVFASRCMWRPTPIGVTTVRLLGIEGNVLKVRGLDAIDGTDVFDIKPYWPQYDAAAQCRYPQWVDRLEF